MTSPTRLDFVIPPLFVTRFDDGLAALRAYFGAPLRSPDASWRRSSVSPIGIASRLGGLVAIG
jgi:hypothetical protein